MMVSNMDGGDLYVKIKIWVTGYCYNIEVHLRKTNEPLKYTALKGTSVIYIVKIPVKDHCIFFCEGKRHRKRYCKAKLNIVNLAVNKVNDFHGNPPKIHHPVFWSWTFHI
ncbi:von Ebner gland protein 1-like [Rattus norvegicus]|uniref:von Ebner gland protein 1-like n=1 Tax=Rattus norvegicus TaxID=10116 RepID=UPI002FD80CA1